MAVIRPFNPPLASSGVNPQQTLRPASTPAQTPRSAAEAKAAQRAFFQQALGDATPVRAAPVAGPAAHSQAAPPTRDIVRPLPDEPPSRPMRPGSFIDIKV